MRLPREFWIPKNPTKIIERPDLGAIVYFNDDQHGIFAVGFSGKRAKPDFQYKFKSSEDREKYLNERYFWHLAEIQKNRKERKESRTKARDEFLKSIEPGKTILSDSWGWEQTQVEFYKVLEVKGCKIKIIKLAEIPVGEATSWASDRVIPGGEIGQPIWRVASGAGCRIDSVVFLTMWDGSPKHRSWYA